MDRIVSESISDHMENKEAIRNSQHRSSKHKSCLSSPVNFSDKMTGCMDDGKAVDAKCLDSLDSCSHRILVYSLRTYGLSEWSIRWAED